MKPTPEQIENVERHKWSLRRPMTQIEKADFRCKLAAVRAEDERLRAPPPQLQLEEAA